MFPVFKWPPPEQWCVFWKEFYIETTQYSGLRAIWHKIKPPLELEIKKDGYRKPATFPLWVIGTYVAFFGVASQRYENRVDIIENRANAIFVQLATPAYKKALSQIPRVQQMRCPTDPDILNPYSVWRSLFSTDTVYQEIVDHLKDTIVSWKSKLDSTELIEIDLSKADLNWANFSGANLSGANLSGTYLIGANLEHTDLSQTDLSGANLINASLINAFLSRANFSGANLNGANLSKTLLTGAISRPSDFFETDSSGAILYTVTFYYKVNFRKANLREADLTEAILFRADFRESNLREANLREAGLSGANFSGSNLSGANLSGASFNATSPNFLTAPAAHLKGAIGLNIEQLCSTKSLYYVEIDSTLLEQIKKKCPYLLEEPK